MTLLRGSSQVLVGKQAGGGSARLLEHYDEPAFHVSRPHLRSLAVRKAATAQHSGLLIGLGAELFRPGSDFAALLFTGQ